MTRTINPTPQFLDDAGDPLNGGKVYFYDSGSNNPKTTYADIGLAIPNTNPVVLSASGRLPNVFFDGTAKVVLTDSSDVQIWERDQVGAGQVGAFVDWDALSSYSYNDIRQASDDNFYISLTSSNLGNDPTSSPSDWSQVKFVGVWNTNETYDLNDTVESGGYLFRSLVSSNQGNATTDDTKWGIAVDLTNVTITTPTIIGAINSSFTGSIQEETYTLSGLDLDPANGTIQTKTLSGAVTLTSSLTDGEYLTLHLLGGDVHTVTWPTVSWLGGSAPVLTAKNVVEFWCIGSTLYAASAGAYS